MAQSLKQDTLIIKRRGIDRVYTHCPHCDKTLKIGWENLNEGDINPARICPSCNITWIWRFSSNI